MPLIDVIFIHPLKNEYFILVGPQLHTFSLTKELFSDKRGHWVITLMMGKKKLLLLLLLL